MERFVTQVLPNHSFWMGDDFDEILGVPYGNNRYRNFGLLDAAESAHGFEVFRIRSRISGQEPVIANHAGVMLTLPGIKGQIIDAVCAKGRWMVTTLEELDGPCQSTPKNIGIRLWTEP